MAYEDNENGYHGYRFLVDAKNERQYAIRYDNGKPTKPFSVFDGDFKKNETIFAMDDETQVKSEGGKTRISTVAYQLKTDATGEVRGPGAFKQVGVDYDVSFKTAADGSFSLSYKLSAESKKTIEEMDFAAGFPQEFTEKLNPKDPGLRRDSTGAITGLDQRLLSNLSFPPHHNGGAHVARFNIETAPDTTSVMPRPEDIVQETRTPSNQNSGNTRPAKEFNNRTNLPAVQQKMKVPDAAIEAVLRMFCDDLTEKAEQGRLDPVVGRDAETTDSIKILSRRKQASLCYTGEAGVGKTAMFSGVAQYIADDVDVPDSLRGARVLALDLQAMNAGAKYRGEFEAKLKPLIDGLKEREGYLKGRKIILAIDEIHSQLTAGKAEGGSDAGNMMKPFLTAKGISVMGTTTLEEYRKHIEKDGALASRFEQKTLSQPNAQDTLTILEKLWPLIRDHHNIAEDIAKEDLEYMVTMTNRYAPNESQPRKGEKALDMAAASAKFRGSNVVEKEDMVAAVAQMSKLDASFLNKSDYDRMLKMEETLPEKVLGQPGLKQITDGLIGARSGLNDPNQPWGCFVLQGPTGTGKTETCKALAEELFGDPKALIQLNMAEYSEKHSVSRLIGAPPGYVGFDTAEPALTEQIRQRPYSILLLDEIEKAHPDVFNVLLPVLNDGEMTDNQGKKVQFNNVIVIMTSNLGAKEAMAALESGGNSMALGNNTAEKTPEEQQELLGRIYGRARGQFFRPEMVNRIEELGGFVTFIPLATTVIEKLVNIEVNKVAKRIKDPSGAGFKDVELVLSDEVKAQLAKEGYKPDMGARPLRKVVREKIANPIGKWLMGNKVELAKFAAENGGAKLVIKSLDAGFQPEMAPGKEPALIAAPASNDDAKKKPARKPRKKSGPSND